MKPLLSIFCITYNHVNYIRKALDSFLMQKTSFPFVIIIGDDCSTDGTTEIVKEYAAKYPEIIKPIYQNVNVGVERNYFDVANACKTKYVAFCEGDDFWTDEYKLQKQVDFLEKNKDCSICYHPIIVHYEDGSLEDFQYPKAGNRTINKKLELKDILKQNFIPACSVMYRWRFFEKEQIEDVFPKNILPMDWYLHILHSEIGKIGFLPKTMSTYRRHKDGIWAGDNVSDKWFCRNGIPFIRFYNTIEKIFNIDKTKDKDPLILGTIFSALNTSNTDVLKTITEDFQDEILKTVSRYKDADFSKIKKYFKYKKLFNILLISNIISVFILILNFIWIWFFKH